METIKGRSPNTIQGYYLDIRLFLRFLKLHKHLVSADTPVDQIDIADVLFNLFASMTDTVSIEFVNSSAYASTSGEEIS